MIKEKVKQNLPKIIVSFLLLIFFASLITYKVPLPAAQDLPREMSNGQLILRGQYRVLTQNFYSYTEPNQPFANHHWLSGVFFYILNQIVGWDGMVAFKVVFLLLTFFILFYLVMKRGDFWSTAFFSIPVIIILASRSALRPEILSFFFIVLFLYFLHDFEDHPERKEIYWLIPLQLVWVNTHLYFPIGVLMIGGFLFEKILLNVRNLKNNPYVKKLIIVFLGSILVCFINPYGLGGAVYALKVNKDPNFPIASNELSTLSATFRSTPLSENIPGVVFEVLSIILILSFVWAGISRRSKKKPILSSNFIFYLCASIGTISIGFYIIRSLPLFALIFLPAIVFNIDDGFIDLKEWIKDRWPANEILIKNLAIICLAVSIVYLTVRDINKINWYDMGIGITADSENSEKFFKENNLKGPIFNDTDIGSYLIYYLYPQERVFSDNRFGDAYSASFFRDLYLPMVQDENVWEERLQEYNFNILYLNHYDQVSGIRNFIHRRMNDQEWVWVYADDNVVILVRNVSQNEAVIQKYQITWDNIENRLANLRESNNADDELAYADLLNLSGHQDAAMNGYLSFLSKRPYAGKVWYALGTTELNLYNLSDSNPNLALVYLQQAIATGWKTTLTYSYIALAYYRLGEYDLAKGAVMQELKIDPGNEDGLKWMSILSDPGLK